MMEAAFRDKSWVRLQNGSGYKLERMSCVPIQAGDRTVAAVETMVMIDIMFKKQA